MGNKGAIDRKEYDALRADIGGRVSRIFNNINLSITFSLTCIVAIFAALKFIDPYIYPFLFLLPLFILVFVSVLSYCDSKELCNIVGYVIVYYECEPDAEMRWESRWMTIWRKDNKNKPVSHFMRSTSLSVLVILGFISFVLFALFWLATILSEFNIIFLISGISFILLGLFLVVVSFYCTVNWCNWVRYKKEGIKIWREHREETDGALTPETSEYLDKLLEKVKNN